MKKKLAIVLIIGALATSIFGGPKNGPKIADDLDLTCNAPVK